MPSIAEVFMRIHVDSSSVKRDVESGLNNVDTKTAGRSAGRFFGNEFAKESSTHFAALFRGNGGNGGVNWTSLGLDAGRAAAGGIGAALSSGASALPGVGTVGPWGGLAIFTGLAAAAPFAGQALAGGIVGGLGAGIAGIGLYAASKAKPVQDAFSAMKDNINHSLTKIGAPMVPVLQGIINTASGVVTALTPVFTAAETVISGPLKLFADTVLNSFKDPAVKSSIVNVSKAFGSILTALTPAIPGIFNGVAGAISSIAGSVARNPKAFTDFVKFLADIVIFGLNAAAALSNVANWIESHWHTIGPILALPFDQFKAQFTIALDAVTGIFKFWAGVFTGNWGAAWRGISGAALSILHTFVGLALKEWDAIVPVKVRTEIANIFDGVRHDTAHIFDLMLRDTRIVWNDIYGATVGVAIRIGHDVEVDFNNIGAFFARWWGSTKTFFFNSVHIVARVLSDAWNGIKGFISSVFGAIGGFFARWWGGTKTFFSTSVHAVGTVLSGAWNGIENNVKSVFGGIGGFFASWWGGTERFISGAVGKIASVVSGAWSTILDSTKIFWDAIGGFMSAGIRAGENALLTVLNGVINVLNGIIAGYNAANNIWSGTDIHPISHLSRFAEGGKIKAGTHETADDVVIRVSKGETVLSAAHSRILEGAGILGAVGVPGFATGGQILSDATKFNHHRYVWGGASNPKSGWDCSSFVGYILGHDFNYPLPGGAHWNGSVHGPTANQFVSQPGFHMVSHNIKDILPGDLLVENSGGHVGFGVGPNQMFSAYDTASGTIFSNAANMTNILRSTGGPGVYNGPGGTISAAQQKAYNALITLLNKDINTYSPAAIAKAFAQTADTQQGILSVPGLRAYEGLGGNVATRSLPAVTAKYNAAVAAMQAAMGPEGDPAGVGGSAGELANGKQLYNYLLKNLFGGNKIAAAGAIASIWGESTWNPFAQGTGGRGLIGWTPAGTISDKDFRGGMATQLPAILRFVTSSGDSGTIAQMFRATSVLQAANEWGHGVERFGINDVHSEGLSLAKQIAGLKRGGRVKAFANGGTIGEPIVGMGASGQMYSFGENGTEHVANQATMEALVARLDRLIALTAAAPGRTAGGVAKAITAPHANMAQAARAGAR